MITHNLQFPDDVHPDSLLLCSEIAKKMANKMLNNQRKYGWTNEWKESGLGWMDQCRIELLQHLQKGDPLDVLIYCAFLVHFDEPTVLAGDVMVSSEILGWYVGIVNKLTARINDWIEVHEDQRRLVRELDEIWNGQGNAAPQASLCDIVAQIKTYRANLELEIDKPLMS